MVYILSEYIDVAMAQAVYDKLEDGTFGGRIPSCVGVLAFGNTLRECEDELRSTLEDWILVGLKLVLRQHNFEAELHPHPSLLPSREKGFPSPLAGEGQSEREMVHQNLVDEVLGHTLPVIEGIDLKKR